ncbi:MAG: acyltransferase [Pseudomonadota bacterium]
MSDANAPAMPAPADRRMVGDFAAGRDNNFNLIRMAAATGVLVSHAWPIALGDGAIQPLLRLTGHTLGTLCVEIFFVISGFLITASFVRSSTRIRFIFARVLRLMPGLIVSILVVTLGMGAIVTTLPTGAYYTSVDTWMAIARNITMAFPLYTLPGVFETNPYPTVQGSIWTLIHEVLCYVGVFVLGIFGIFKSRMQATIALVLYAAVWFAVPLFEHMLHPKIVSFLDLSMPFAIGAAIWVWRDRIPMSLPAVLVLIALWYGVRLGLGSGPVTEVMYSLAVAYATFWLAFMPAGILRAYNRLGDYSYGMYIYAFPIQGLVIWIWGPMGPLENILFALPLTLIPSVLSWHLVEKPSLDLLKPLTGLFRTPRQTSP